MVPDNDVKQCGEYPAVTIASELQHIRLHKLQDIYRRIIDAQPDRALCRLASHLMDNIDAGLETLEALANLKGPRADG